MAEMTIEKAIGIISFARNHRKECGVAASDFDHAIDVALTALCEKQEQLVARPYSDWGEDYGDVVWWNFPIGEALYVGTPLDASFPDYVTHWTPLIVPERSAE